jgi:transposase InsO family protein
MDNGKQFDNQDFMEFCASISTRAVFASVYHPQSNGVVERANGKIFTAIKKGCEKIKRANGQSNYPKPCGH